MKAFTLCAVLLLARGAAPASAGGTGEAAGNPLAVFNAWLVTAAQSDPRWRTEIRPDGAGAVLPPGRYRARSAVLGAFSYRPRTYAELRPEERLELLGQPEVRRLLRSPAERTREIRFAISPEEMRLNRPFIFTVPAP